jgi:hypothetical protein
MFAFTKVATSVNAMEDNIKVVQLVRKTGVIVEDVGLFLATGACNNANGLNSRIKNRWVLATIIQRGLEGEHIV